MSMINKIPNGFSYQIKDEIVCVESYRENCIRVRCTRNGSLPDERYTLLEAEGSYFAPLTRDSKPLVPFTLREIITAHGSYLRRMRESISSGWVRSSSCSCAGIVIHDYCPSQRNSRAY